MSNWKKKLQELNAKEAALTNGLCKLEEEVVEVKELLSEVKAQREHVLLQLSTDNK